VNRALKRSFLGLEHACLPCGHHSFIVGSQSAGSGSVAWVYVCGTVMIQNDAPRNFATSMLYKKYAGVPASGILIIFFAHNFAIRKLPESRPLFNILALNLTCMFFKFVDMSEM
jgi:hypothetical protein